MLEMGAGPVRNLGSACTSAVIGSAGQSNHRNKPRRVVDDGPRTDADLDRRARRYANVAAALDHTHMQDGIARPSGNLYQAESLVRVVPFDYGVGRGT